MIKQLLTRPNCSKLNVSEVIQPIAAAHDYSAYAYEDSCR